MAGQTGDLERATAIANETLTTARAITNPDDRAHVLAEVARAAADASDFELAGTAAREITIPFWQPQVLAELALAAKETGDLEQARKHWLASIDLLAKISPAAVIAIADEYLSVPTSANNFQWANPPPDELGR